MQDDAENAKKLSRRELFKWGAGAGAAAFLGAAVPGLSQADVTKPAAAALPQVPRRRLGKTKVEIPILLMGGAMKFDPKLDPKLAEALRFGVNYIDTADCYAGGTSETGASGTSGPGDTPLAVSFDTTYLTIANNTGSAIVNGKVELVMSGPRPPFVARIDRIENRSKQNLAFSSFRGIDGTDYNRRLGKVRRVKVSATDVAGKSYAMEVPFQ